MNMDFVFFIFVLLGLIASGTCYKVCYGDLGCFDDTLPCHQWAPDSPQDVGVTFTLFTRENRNTGTVLDRRDHGSIKSSSFRADRETKFLVHGWTDSMSGEPWPVMTDALLDNYDVNVVQVDWQRGAATLYFQSRANTRVVGREIGRMIEAMYLATRATFRSMHVIGHSLGAHIGGYAGEACANNLGRISAMDPAGPFYTGDLDKGCRLDRTDALFVDALHTDGEPLIGAGGDGNGLMDQLGHQDFYPNGGQDMPGCNLLPPLPSCDHARVVEYYIESISSSCTFTSSVWAATWDDIENENGRACSWDVCPEMGYHADARKGTGAFFLETNAISPYCQG